MLMSVQTHSLVNGSECLQNTHFLTLMTSIIKAKSSANKQDWSCNYRLKYPSMQLDYENKQLYQQDRQSNRQSVSLN